MVSRDAQRGVTFLALLLAVALTSGALAAGAAIWSRGQQREREKQLLWAGDQIRRAIVAYSQITVDGVSRYPTSLADLLLDPRSVVPRRYLRRIYDDPMTRSTDWGLIHDPAGRLVGVYTRSNGVPIKRAGFDAPYVRFETASTYADWRFSALFNPADADARRKPAASVAIEDRRTAAPASPASAPAPAPSTTPVPTETSGAATPVADDAAPSDDSQ
jgi:type II secretory pathway pseudopilin PulG